MPHRSAVRRGSLARAWWLQNVAGDLLTPQATQATQVKIDVPADVPRDGSVAYQGRAIATSAQDRLALIAWVTVRGASAGHVVVHEWDGASLGPMRRLASDVPCPNYVRTLTDGTWVFGDGRSILLVSP